MTCHVNQQNLNITLWCRQISPNEGAFQLSQSGDYEEFNLHEIPTVRNIEYMTDEGCFGRGDGMLITVMRE